MKKTNDLPPVLVLHYAKNRPVSRIEKKSSRFFNDLTEISTFSILNTMITGFFCFCDPFGITRSLIWTTYR